MRTLLILVVLVVFGTTGWTQQDKKNENTDKPQTFVEIMPKFKGGDKAFTKYLSKNIKYPPAEKELGVEGTVYVRFHIMKDGSVANVEVVKGVKDHPAFGAEAVRVISAMPRWKPGIMNGGPVVCEMTVPITFRLK